MNVGVFVLKIYNDTTLYHIDDICPVTFPTLFQVKVMFESSRLTVLEDKPALGLESLLGTIGGTLNLWIGISFVTVIEVIDMLLTLILGGISRPKVESSLGDEKRDPHRMTDVGWGERWGHRKPQQWPLLLTWFNFNPSMDK